MPSHPDVMLALTTCGMTNAQANVFANQHGFMNIGNCMTLRPEMDKDMIKTFNNANSSIRKLDNYMNLN